MLSPRPAKPHAMAATALGEELGPPFKRWPGWSLVFEPELRLGEDVVVPDLAGWRRAGVRASGRAIALATWDIDSMMERRRHPQRQVSYRDRR